MKFTEIKEDSPDELCVAEEPSAKVNLVDDEKLNVPNKGTVNNRREGWVQLCKREVERVNKILAYTYMDWFSLGEDHLDMEKSNGAVAIYQDDDSWYFELVFNAAVPYAFDTAMDIIEDYKKIVGFPSPDAYIFEDISEDKKDDDSGEKQKFFRFVSWTNNCDNVTTADGFIGLCDWLDKIKQMCYFSKEIPDDVVLKRIELNNTWNKVFSRNVTKDESKDAAKKAAMWCKALESWKGAELLKGNKI